MKEMLERIRKFLLHGVWDIELSTLSAGKSLPIRIVRVGQLVFKGFTEDDLPVHASALTFVTLMSIVPMLAVAFALVKGFGFGQDTTSVLLAATEQMPAEFRAFVEQVFRIVDSTNFAAMGWIGLAFVLFTAVLVLGSVEISFNRIWGVRTPRTVFRQTANYISIIVLVPLLIGIASTVEAWLKGSATLLPGGLSLLARNLLRLTSLFTTWLAFGFLFVFLPNTRVRAVPATISSFVTALIWLAWQKIYISLQVGVARYNAIYGTFASVPIFLAWLYAGWVIILLGAELAFALQNASTFQMERAAERANLESRFVLALSVILRAAEALGGGRSILSVSAYAREHRIPIRLLNEMVGFLVRVGLLAETAETEGCFVLVKAPDKIRVREVLDLVMEEGAKPESIGLAQLQAPVRRMLDAMDKGVSDALSDMTVAQLVDQNRTVPAP